MDMNMSSVKVTEELIESWRREFQVQKALGTVKVKNISEINNPNREVYRVKFIRSYSPAVVSETTVVALHAHHAVSIVLGWDRGNLSFNKVSCDNAGWHSAIGWSDYESD